jgi:hypothetical protein
MSRGASVAGLASTSTDRWPAMSSSAGRRANCEIPRVLQATDFSGSLVVSEKRSSRQACPTAGLPFSLHCSFFLRAAIARSLQGPTPLEDAWLLMGRLGAFSTHPMIEACSAGDARNPIMGSLPIVLAGLFMNWIPNGSRVGRRSFAKGRPGCLFCAIAPHWTHKGKCLRRTIEPANAERFTTVPNRWRRIDQSVASNARFAGRQWKIWNTAWVRPFRLIVGPVRLPELLPHSHSARVGYKRLDERLCYETAERGRRDVPIV